MNNFLSPNINFQSLSAQSLTAVISNAKLDQDFKIDWSTSSLSGFVFFGSAYSITQLAINKILQTYPINSLSSVSASSSDFEMAQKYYYSYSQFEQQIFNGFSLSLNGIYNNDTFTIKNIPRNIDNTVIELNDQIYINGLLSDAQIYDSQNKNMLQNFIPDKFLEYDDNGIFTGLLNIWGQTFDQILLYTSQFSNNLFNTDYINLNRVIDDYNTLNLLGMNVYTNYLFSSLLDFLIVTDNKVSYKAIQENVWNRILNNLIYIYKSKGTLESIKAFINCIGLNMDLIKIHEYVNFTTPQYVNTIKNINYFELNFGSSASTYISATSNAFNLNLTEWSIICNLNLKGINKTQNLFGVPNQYNLALVDSSTFDDYGQPILAGYISFTGYLANGTTMILTSSTGNIWSYDPQTLIVQRTLSGYELYLNKIDLYYNGSQTQGSNIEIASITSIATGYYDFGLYDVNLYDASLSSLPVFYLGNNGNFNNTYSGSIINLKIFNTSLNANQIDDFSTNLSRLNLIKENLNNNVLVNWLFDEPLYLAYINNNYQYSSITGVNPERIILDSSTGFINGTATGFSYFPNGNYYTTDTLDYPTQRFVSGLTRYSDKINIDGNLSYTNTKYLSLDVAPTTILNESFEYLLGPVDFFDYMDSTDFNTNNNKYAGLENLKNIFYSSSIDIDGFYELINNVDEYAVGLFQSLYQFLPANASLLYNGILIESPVYDRNKHILRNLDLEIKNPLDKQIIISTLTSNKINSVTSNINDIITVDNDIIFSNDSIITANSITSNLINSITSLDYNMYDLHEGIIQQIDAPIDINLLEDVQNSEYFNTDIYLSSLDHNIEYLKTKENSYKLFKINNNVYSPIETSVNPNIADVSISGIRNVYLSDSFTGKANLDVNYIDSIGDNIIGTKYVLRQNIDGKLPLFNVVDLDNNLTSNALNQSYYITDYSGSNLRFDFITGNASFQTADQPIRNVISISGEDDKEFYLTLKWLPDTRSLYAVYPYLDIPSITRYSLFRWNISLDTPNILSVDSNYGIIAQSNFFVTTASWGVINTSASSNNTLTIYFQNYSDIDGELNINFAYSKSFATEHRFALTDIGTTSTINYYAEAQNTAIQNTYGDNLVFFNQTSINTLKVKIDKNSSKGFNLNFNGDYNTNYFSNGNITFATNQYLYSVGNNPVYKTFLLNFSTLIAYPPSLISPLNGYSNTGSSVTFHWNSVIGASSYSFYISTTPDMSSIYDSATGLTNTQYPESITSGGTYYWGVKSVVGINISQYSQIWRFTSLNLPPVISAPADNSKLPGNSIVITYASNGDYLYDSTYLEILDSGFNMWANQLLTGAAGISGTYTSNEIFGKVFSANGDYYIRAQGINTNDSSLNTASSNFNKFSMTGV